MDKRRHRRYKRRLTVDLDLGGQFLRAFIIDLSSSGMFIQTNQSINPGTVVAVRFAPTSTNPMIIVRAVVARRRAVPAHLRAIAASGLGLEVLEAPPEYQSVVLPPLEAATRSEKGAASATAPVAASAKKTPPRSAPSPAAPSPSAAPSASSASKSAAVSPTTPAAVPAPAAEEASLRRFKVFATQIGGTRSRTITIESKNGTLARGHALVKLGGDWEILRVDAVD